MAVQNYLAGIPTLGEDLPQVANMLHQRASDDRRNALYEQKFAADQQQMASQQQAQRSEQELRERLAEMEMYSQAPPEIKAQYVAMQRQRHPEFANTPFASMPPEQAFEGMLRGLQAKLGMSPASAPKRDIRTVGGALLEVPQEGDPRVLYQAPERPDAGHGAMQEPFDVQTYRYFLQQPPEVQAKILEYRRGNSTPEIVAENTVARERGKVAVAAQTDLPRVEANATDLLRVLDQLERSPGFNYLWGAYSLTPTGAVPGTSQADALAIWEQVQGKAFLEAFNTLKGGGQITEKEGEKATAAITRLATRKQSAESARAAIRDLRKIVQDGVNRARQKAGQAPERREAPPSAVEYLRQHPETAGAFKAKYGYLP